MSQKLASLLSDQRGLVRARDTSDWEALRELILAECHPAQRNFVADTSRWVSAVTPRGVGKTTAARARIVRRMAGTPRARCLFVATTRGQAEELLWPQLKEIVEKLGIDATFNETKLRCTFRRNGSTVRLVGADDKKEIDKLRGQPFHEVIIDEGASYDLQLLDHLIHRIIVPRLGDYDGSLVIVGTPGHDLRGEFYDATRPGSDKHRPWVDRDKPEYAGWDGWSSHTWNLLDGAPYVEAMARLWASALATKARNGWSDKHPVWLREYLGQWAADDTDHVLRYRPHLEDGTPWNQWDPAKDKRTGLAVLPEGRDDWRFVYGMDLGYSDPFALCVLAWSPTDTSKTLYHVYEFSKKGIYSREIAKLLVGEELDVEHPKGIVGATGWPDAIVCDTATAGEAFIQEMGNVYGIRVVSAKKRDKFDHVELVNGDLVDGRLKVLKGSVLEEQAVNLQWVTDEYGRLKENKAQRNDQVDALLYARGVAAHMLAEELGPPAPFFPPRRDPVDDDGSEKDDGGYSEFVPSESYDREDFWGNY